MSEEKLVELRQRAGELERLKLTKEAQADQAEAHYRAAIDKLRMEFGVETPEAAAELLKQKKHELDKLIESIQGALGE